MPTATPPAPPAPSGPQSPAPQGPTPPQQREPSDKTRKGLKIIMTPILIGLALLVIAVIAIVSLTGEDDSEDRKSPKSIVPSQIEGAGDPTGTVAERGAAFKWLLAQGYKYDPTGYQQFSFKIVEPVPMERGAAAVGENPIIQKDQLVRWINSDSKRAKAYRRYIKDRMSARDYRRIMDGRGFVRVQFLVPTVYERNSYLSSGGRVVTTNAERRTKAGDVAFVYASAPVRKKLPNGRTELVSKVKPTGNTRGPCVNPGVIMRPARAGEKVPSVNVPIREKERIKRTDEDRTTTTPPGQRRKDPRSLEEIGRERVFGKTRREMGEHSPFGDPNRKTPPHRKVDRDPADAPAKSPIVNNPVAPAPAPPPRTPPSTGGNTGGGAPVADEGGGTVTGPTGPPANHTPDGGRPVAPNPTPSSGVPGP